MTTTNLNGLSQQEVYTKIRNVFFQEYKDLGVYRYLNRSKQFLKVSFSISFIAALVIALFGNAWPITWWAFAFIGAITMGGVDHFIIGLRFKRMLRKLNDMGIVISLATLLEVCEDIIPE
jgi:ABC-type Fe3+-siderophore transport system permease subunit